MKRSGFSMIELVFVIVILGVLAAVAVPRFVTTRTDAQVAMLRSDIASTLKAIPARIFAENLDPTASSPSGFSNWSEWIIDTAGLDRGRWMQGTMSGGKGISPITQLSNSGVSVNIPCGNSALILIDTTTGTLKFDPTTLKNQDSSQAGTLCVSLMNSYPSNSNRIIPLASNSAVKF